MADEEKRQANGAQPEENAQPTEAMPASGAQPEEAQAAPAQPFLGFVGSYTHGIDAKGRMIIPAAFREPLGARFAVCPTPDFKAVAIYPLSGWQERRDELVALVKYNARAQRLLDQFSKYSYVDCEADAQGRILLPQNLRDYAGLTKDVTIVGCNNHAELWDSARWNEIHDAEMTPENVAAVMEELEF